MTYRNLEREINIDPNISGASSAVGFGRAGTPKEVRYVTVETVGKEDYQVEVKDDRSKSMESSYPSHDK